MQYDSIRQTFNPSFETKLSRGKRDMKWAQANTKLLYKNIKGHNFVKTDGRVMVLSICASSDSGLNSYIFS